MNFVISEMQENFDFLESMVDGLAVDSGITLPTLDDETLLNSIESMIKEEKILSEEIALSGITKEAKRNKRKDQYQKEFQHLREEKNQLRGNLLKLQSFNKQQILQHLKENKKKITQNSIEETAKIVENKKSVTKRDIDAIYLLSLKKNIRITIFNYIDQLE